MSLSATLPPSERTGLLSRSWALSTAQAAAAAISICALWFLFRPYQGVRGDAVLYLGKALASVSARPLSSDFMFTLDGQFGMSIFPAVAERLVAALGLSTASLVLAVGGLAAWLLAMTAVATRMGEGRRLWAMLACTALLPSSYSYWFRSGEPVATPRVFAEASVLVAMALLLSGRRLVAVPFLLLAAALHPVMALCGFGVLFLTLAFEDRRWLWAGLAAAAAGIGAGALGAPMLERLFQSLDPAWVEVVQRRSKVVFPSTWPLQEWTRTGLQITTVVVAATLASGRLRLVLGAVAATAALGLAASVLIGDLLGSMLVAQAQTWRAAWLAAALAPACLVFSAARLWGGSPHARLTLAALALGWAGYLEPAVAGPAAALALACRGYDLRGRELKLSPLVPYGLLACAVAVAGAELVAELRGAFEVHRDKPSGVPLPWTERWPAETLPPFLAAAALWLGVRSRPVTGGWNGLVLTGAVALAGLTALVWDIRSPTEKALDRREGSAELSALLARSPGAVYWLGGVGHSWFWADRPGWFSMAQGAGVVFSRPLALHWGERHRTLVNLGLEEAKRDGANQSAAGEVFVTAPAARAVCALPDAPAWIIAPRERVTPLGSALVSAVWSPPAAAHSFKVEDEAVRWSATRAYALIACADVRGERSPPALRPAAS